MQVSCRLEEILLTPGPTYVPERIFQAMNKPSLHHRTETFKEYLLTARDGIKWLTRSETDPIFLAGSGTAAMEAALLNLLNRGEEILVLNAGKFGERWLHIAEKLGIVVHELKAVCGESVDLHELKSSLEKNKNIKAACMQVCETSTTVELPVREICDLIKQINPSVLTIVDAVSAIATVPIHLDKLKIDVLVSAGHKGLMLTPGLAIAILNEKSWQIAEKNQVPSLYFNLSIERKAAKKDTTAWTPAMNQIVGLAESIQMIKEEGEDNVYKRHATLSQHARDEFNKLSLKPMTVKYPSNGVSGIYMPDGIDAEKIRKEMYKEHRVIVAGGQEELQGKVIRFGHMGSCQLEYLQKGIDALKMVLGK
jgi:aspartate aminotransferase-like enzyme